MSSTKPVDQTLCHCGRPLHYSDPMLKATVESLIRQAGWFVTVTVGDRSWKVPRHYIALHPLCGADLPDLGFEEITNEANK